VDPTLVTFSYNVVRGSLSVTVAENCGVSFPGREDEDGLDAYRWGLMGPAPPPAPPPVQAQAPASEEMDLSVFRVDDDAGANPVFLRRVRQSRTRARCVFLCVARVLSEYQVATGRFAPPRPLPFRVLLCPSRMRSQDMVVHLLASTGVQVKVKDSHTFADLRDALAGTVGVGSFHFRMQKVCPSPSVLPYRSTLCARVRCAGGATEECPPLLAGLHDIAEE
jgi:hypothetical protein